MEKSCKISTVERKYLGIKSEFGKSVVYKHILAQTPSTKNPDFESMVVASLETINSIHPQDNIQLMLASQMTSIHNFQQKIMSYAVNTNVIANVVKLGNLAAKLSNVFVQQVQLMKTLQGGGEKKVIFEHVHIHSGAQAVVGTVNASIPPKE